MSNQNKVNTILAKIICDYITIEDSFDNTYKSINHDCLINIYEFCDINTKLIFGTVNHKMYDFSKDDREHYHFLRHGARWLDSVRSNRYLCSVLSTPMGILCIGTTSIIIYTLVIFMIYSIIYNQDQNITNYNTSK